MAAHSAKSGVYKVKQDSISKPALLCRDYLMSGDVFHVPALGEQITNIAKISIIGNLRNSLLIYPHCFRNFLLRPSKAAQAKDICISACFLPGSNI
jgi:hypothetical protein